MIDPIDESDTIRVFQFRFRAVFFAVTEQDRVSFA